MPAVPRYYLSRISPGQQNRLTASTVLIPQAFPMIAVWDLLIDIYPSCAGVVHRAAGKAQFGLWEVLVRRLHVHEAYSNCPNALALTPLEVYIVDY